MRFEQKLCDEEAFRRRAGHGPATMGPPDGAQHALSAARSPSDRASRLALRTGRS